jgi:hypothetical protein
MAGCNGSQSANHPADRVGTDDSKFEKSRSFHLQPVSKFAGRVTVDGHALKKDTKLFVILTDARQLDENSHGGQPKLFTVCDDEGKFAFGTYDLKDRKDGVVAGKYVVTFVQLHKFVPPAAKRERPTASSTPARNLARYALPDDLKNLYSDPDKNVKDKNFNLDLVPPGKDDYHFDLTVAGKDSIAKPAPHAVTYLVLVQ